MQIIKAKTPKEARSLIDKQAKQGKKAIVKARDIEFNRKILENKKVNTLILSHKNKKDKLRERDSGLNHILCKIAKENKIILALDFKELAGKKQERAEILARILQNIKLIKKFKNKFKLINYKNKEQARAFLLTLGLPTDMAKKAVG